MTLSRKNKKEILNANKCMGEKQTGTFELNILIQGMVLSNERIKLLKPKYTSGSFLAFP